jgi:hypothetical protein
MNTKTWGDASLKGIQKTDTTSIQKTVEQIYPFSTTYACAVPVQATSKANILKLLSSNRVYDIRDNSLFIDTRKQQVFDWQKNTNAYQRIIHLSDLEDQWDGYNAPKFSKEQIDLALHLYSNLRTYCIHRGLDFSKVEPFIAPSSDGKILFEWAGKRFPSRQLEIYIPVPAEDKLEYLETGENFEFEGEFHLEQLYSILDWLFKFDC